MHARSMGAWVRAWSGYVLAYIPGLVLLGALAWVARAIGAPSRESFYLVYAVVLGILVRNLIGLSAVFEPGTRLYEVLWKVGIVLLGSQMALDNFRQVGVKIILLAGFEGAAVILVTLAIGSFFKIPAPLCYLLAIGMGICGVSAIIALSGVLATNEEDTAYAVSVILVFGLGALAVLPLIALLLHMSPLHFGLWAGLSIDNTAEAVATGFVHSEAAGRYATIAKLCRNTFLPFALLYFVHRSITEKRTFQVQREPLLSSMWRYFPKFALGLVLFSVLSTLHFWPPASLVQMNHLYRWALLLGFAGIGLRTELGNFGLRGIRPLVLALTIQVIVLLGMFGLTWVLF